MKVLAASLSLLVIGVTSAFQLPQYTNQPKGTTLFPAPRSKSALNSATAAVESNDAPPLTKKPPRQICLMVEPTPFTHVSGYSNRFTEMLRYLSKAGDKVDIVTVDAQTPEEDLPSEKFGFKIDHTQGFTFPLYNHISLTLDLPEMKAAAVMEKNKPDLIHASSP